MQIFNYIISIIYYIYNIYTYICIIYYYQYYYISFTHSVKVYIAPSFSFYIMTYTHTLALDSCIANQLREKAADATRDINRLLMSVRNFFVSVSHDRGK